MEVDDISEIAEIFTNINTVETMIDFFNEILTARERKILILRWQLMKMLNKKIPQRKIASALRISSCKIARGSKILKDKKSVSRNVLKMIH